MYENIVKGLNEAIEYEKGHRKNTRTRTIFIPELPDYRASKVRDIRNRCGLTQKLFAELLGVSQKTVEAWESGRNVPHGPAQRFLSVLDQHEELREQYIQSR